MTRRKRTKVVKPIQCPVCATELPDAFIRASANSLAGSKDRPGAIGLVRNPTGKAKRCSACGYTKEDAQYNMDHHLCSNAGNAPWER